jgi:hypothetical protein
MSKKRWNEVLVAAGILAAAVLASRQPVRADGCIPRPSGALRVLTVSEAGGAATADYAGAARLTSVGEGVVDLVVNTTAGTYFETYRVSSAAAH